MRRIFCATAVMVLVLVQMSAHAQGRGGGGRDLPPGENIFGKVTAVGKNSLTIAKLQGGDSITLKISESTRVRKDREPYKFEEIKVDDTVFARGELKDGVMQTAILSVVSPEMAQRFMQAQNGGGGGAGSGMGRGNRPAFNPEDMGKKFIIGEVKAINETKLTIARRDGQTQEIEVDENTSFKKDNQSITLPEIKVGDLIYGRGELKNNVFVPKELNVGGAGGMRRMGGGFGGPAPQQSAPTAAPSTTPSAAPDASPAQSATPSPK